MWLDIRILSSVNLAEAVDGKLLYLVHHLATAVIALAGIALGIFVRAYRTHCLHNLCGDIVLGCDQLQPLGLSVLLFSYKIENL